MNFRVPTDKQEESMLMVFTAASQLLYHCDWKPGLSVDLWERAFVKGLQLDLVMLCTQTGSWVDWSLRHGQPMIVSYSAWLLRLKHPDKQEVMMRCT